LFALLWNFPDGKQKEHGEREQSRGAKPSLEVTRSEAERP